MLQLNGIPTSRGYRSANSDGALHRLAAQILGLAVLPVHVADHRLVTERARIRAPHARDESLHRHVAKELVLVINLAIRHRQLVERHGRADLVSMDRAVARLHVQVADPGDVRPALHGIGQLQHRQLAFAAADDVDTRAEDHVGRVRRMGTADDDRDVQPLLDEDRQLFQ